MGGGGCLPGCAEFCNCFSSSSVAAARKYRTFCLFPTKKWTLTYTQMLRCVGCGSTGCCRHNRSLLSKLQASGWFQSAAAQLINLAERKPQKALSVSPPV